MNGHFCGQKATVPAREGCSDAEPALMSGAITRISAAHAELHGLEIQRET